MSSARSLGSIAWRALCWAAGYQAASALPAPCDDDLEPYCAEKTLLLRQRSGGTFDASEQKAVRKIAARYGAEL